MAENEANLQALAKKYGGKIEYDEAGKARITLRKKISFETLAKYLRGQEFAHQYIRREISPDVLAEVVGLLLEDPDLVAAFLATLQPDIIKSDIADKVGCDRHDVRIETVCCFEFPHEGQKVTVTLVVRNCKSLWKVPHLK